MAETVAYVSTAKPAVGGAIYVKTSSSAVVPTDATTSLGTGWTSLGYISEDGLVNSNSPETDTSKAWGGDTVLKLQTAKPDTFKFKLLEVLNEEVLKIVYGTSNVSGTLAAGLTVSATSDEAPSNYFVVDVIMRDGAVKRILIPAAEITEVGDIVYKDDEAMGYEITIAAMPDANGVTHKELIKKT